MQYYGRLNDLVDLPPPRLFEATPFVLGKVEHRAAGAQNVLSHGWFAGGSAGLDALAHLTNELTLDLTVNPDFGQVEADTVILNLSTFETFFPEKRRFFLEGLDVFATLRPVFYTRRIGRQPAAPTLSTGEALVALPDPTRIWSAVKMSGTARRAHAGRRAVGADRRERRRRAGPRRRAAGDDPPDPIPPPRTTCAGSNGWWRPTPTWACWRPPPTGSIRRCRAAGAGCPATLAAPTAVPLHQFDAYVS